MINIETNVFENTPYANLSEGAQQYAQYWMSKAYDAIDEESYAVPCTVDLYKALEKQEVAYTDEQMECDNAFLCLLGEELEKEVEWLDDRRITVKLDGEVVERISMKGWFKSMKREIEEIGEDGSIYKTLVSRTPTLKNGYTHDELWEFLNSCVPQEGVRRFKIATLVLYKKGISIGLEKVK